MRRVLFLHLIESTNSFRRAKKSTFLFSFAEKKVIMIETIGQIAKMQGKTLAQRKRRKVLLKNFRLTFLKFP